jgi:DNA polymerase III subunit epsilon
MAISFHTYGFRSIVYPKVLFQESSMEVRVSDLFYIDFEASSLSQESWPIEIGIAWIEGAGVQSWSTLIRPDASWDLEDWSARSAEVHNIPYEEVMAAPRAVDVAREVRDRLKGKTLVSDNPEFEERWMDKLLALANIPSPDFLHYDLIAQSACHGYPAALDRVYERLERTRVPHRAGKDAERLAKGILRGLQVKRESEVPAGPGPS